MSRMYRNFLGALFCLLLMLCLAPAAFAAQGSTVGELQAAIQKGDTDFTLDGDMSISDGFFDGRYGLTLNVPANTTLTITAGTVELSGLNLSGGQLNLHGGIFRVNQSFAYTGGSVHVYGCWNLFPAADVLRYSYKTVFTHERPDGDNTKLLFNVTTEAEFADAVAAVNDLDSNCYVGHIDVQSPLTMTGQHTITHDTEIDFFAELNMQNRSAIVYDHAGGTVFFCNRGEETTSEIHGELNINSFSVDPDCVLKVGSNANITAGQMNLAGNVELRDNCKFRINNNLDYNGGLIKNYGCFNVYLPASITRIEGTQLSDIISFPEETGACNLLFNVNSDAGVAAVLDYAEEEMTERFGAMMNVCYNWTPTGTVSVPERTQIIINGNRGGSLSIGEGCTLELPERGDLVLDPNASASISGTLVHSGIIVKQNALLEVNGVADFNKLTLNGGTVRLYNNCIFRVNDDLQYNGGTVQVNGKCFNLFPAKDILPDNTNLFSYSGDGLKTDLLFTAKNAEEFASAVSTINGLEDTFIADLNVNGGVVLEGETVIQHKTELRVNADQGGFLNISERALLANNENGGNVFITNNSGAEAPAASVVFGELNTNGLTLDSGCELAVGEGGGVKTHDQLNIPEGAKLTLTRGQLHLMGNSVAIVNGALVNNGFVNLFQRSGSGPRLVVDGGSYSGSGRIGVKDTVDPDSYFSGLDLTPFTKVTDKVGTQYLIVDAELILPNGLQAIESEAFSGGRFQSIFIPPSVTSIAQDAFDGMSGLTIFGFPGTAAQNVTGNNFTFVSLG